MFSTGVGAEGPENLKEIVRNCLKHYHHYTPGRYSVVIISFASLVVSTL